MKRTVFVGLIVATVSVLAFSTLLFAGQEGKGKTMGPGMSMGEGTHGEMHKGAMEHGKMPHGQMGGGPMHKAKRPENGDPGEGKVIYERFCLTCHGASGRGDGPTGRLLTPRPSDFSKRMPHHAEHGADYYFKIIKEGGRAVGRSPVMVPWGAQLRDGEIWDVISYIQALAKGH